MQGEGTSGCLTQQMGFMQGSWQTLAYRLPPFIPRAGQEYSHQAHSLPAGSRKALEEHKEHLGIPSHQACPEEEPCPWWKEGPRTLGLGRINSPGGLVALTPFQASLELSVICIKLLTTSAHKIDLPSGKWMELYLPLHLGSPKD